MFLFARKSQDKGILLKTESLETAERFVYLLKRNFDIFANISSSGTDRKTYYVSVSGTAQQQKIANFYGIQSYDGIDAKFLKHSCCSAAFLRAVFLVCGTVSDPENSYHLELGLKREELADDLLEIIAGVLPLPNSTKRSNRLSLYYKDGDSISDFLTFIGASQFSLEMMGIKILNDMKLTISRRTNCETANLAKTTDAAMKHMAAIEYLEKENYIKLLPQELKDAAKLRKEHPEASLSELVKIAGNTMTRSGLNHRLNRLVEAAERYKEEKK